MSHTRPLIALTLAATAVAITFSPLTLANADEDPLLIKSRELTAQFASELQAALQEAMSAGGPVDAISVCRDRAPQIASKLSRESGAKVSRTSLKYRNPGNAPEPWQEIVLLELNAMQAGELINEYFEHYGNNGARYLKPIATGGLCLACHGSELSIEVRQQLDLAYPHDLARDYSAGDIRGAFSITWPDTESAASD